MTATTEDLRGTILGAFTRTGVEARVIAHGTAVLARSEADGFPWPQGDSGLIHMTAEGLRDSLAEHAGLLDGSRHPESVFPDLGRWQDNALEIALERVTEDIADWARALVMEVRERCGEDAAAMVRGQNGGE